MKRLKQGLMVRGFIFFLAVVAAMFSIVFVWIGYFFLSTGSLSLSWFARLCGENATWKGVFEEICKDFYDSNDPVSEFAAYSVAEKPVEESSTCKENK